MTARPSTLAFLVLACGSVIVMLSFGTRASFGLYMWPVSSELGWGRDVLSFAIALQSLVWGVSTPLFGFLSDRYGPGKVVCAGGLMYVAGLGMMSQASQPLDATISIGVITGFASAMTSFPIVLSVISRKVPAAKRSLYLGIASAVGSSGQMILIPLDEFFISTSGWAMSLIYMALIAGLIVPLSVAMAGGNKPAGD